MCSDGTCIPAVSVLCTAYNHEKYIRDALNGFLIQKTSFPFEIIVHDDASTDLTQKLIQEISDANPGRIKAVLQQENQHSKGRKIIREILLPMARGKYIALCEGDDFWIDPHKLQIQYDYMESHKDCMLCVHANRIMLNDGKIKGLMRYKESDADISIVDCLKRNSPPAQTATYFIRRELYSMFSKSYYASPVGDYPLCVEAARLSYIHYIDRIMSIYRALTPGSWSMRVQNNTHFRVMQLRKDIEYSYALLEVLPEYADLIITRIKRCQFSEMLYCRRKAAFQSEYYKSLPLSMKLRYRLYKFNPRIYYMLKEYLYGKVKLND